MGIISEKLSQNLSQEYRDYQQDFNFPPLSERFDPTTYEEARFIELAKDPNAKKSIFSKTTVDEARSALQAEIEGYINNPQRSAPPVSKSVDLDFKVDGPYPYTDLNIKHSVGRVYPSYQHPVELKIAKVIPRKADRISYKSNKEILLLIYLTDPRLSSNEQLLKMVNELRGGSWAGVLGSAAFFGILFFITILSGESFFLPQPNPGWVLPNGLYDPPGLVRPASCMTQLDAGSPTQSLKTWNDRNEPNPKDRWFLVESRPELVMRRGQSKFKTKDHGALAGLPYVITSKGGTSTLKTSRTVDHFMDVVETIVYDPNSTWFEEGTYQGNTDREEEAIHVYSKRHNRIAVFLRSTGEFVTFCEPTESEIRDLFKNHNFGGRGDWFSGKPKNLPPKQEFIFDFTPINMFESDVMGITYGSSMDKKASPKENFTPLNSFETDILGITPIDPDWQN